ncbi:LamG domain-containing protein [Hamadaea sp. NPDC051192]|uniref:LamG domain-containing protein n=1 Tax=Hamadaea sp. NPDC051192 TaxID=3154940 RepID=UPI003437161F
MSQTFANPSGSLTTVMSASPQRARRDDGSWAPIDTTLRRLSDGTLAPVNAAAAVRFSGGGDGPLATFIAGGGRLSYSWPSALPAAAIDGDTAVYTEIMPGVDLRVRALADGFTYSLVVKTATAASNPGLASVSLGLAASGLAIKPQPDGGFDAATPAGHVAISSGTGLMWDAAGLSAQSQTEARASTLAADQIDVGNLAAQVPDQSATAEVATTATGSALTIRPDLALLADPTTVYPVIIDPVSKTISQTGWGYTDSTNATRDDEVARVGLNPDGSGTYRSFFSFNSGATIGRPATVLKAQFQTYMTHSWACTATPVNLYSVSAFNKGKNTWSGPALGAWIGEQTGNAHKPSQGGEGCGSDPQPDDYMEWTNDTLKSGVQYALDQGWSTYALGLLNRQQDGTSETTSNWWKKFDPARTSLYVEWNKNPTTPASADMETAPSSTLAGTSCTTANPLIRSSAPVLRAKLRDPDNEAGGLLTGTFVTQEWDPTGEVWRDPPLVGRPGVSQATKSVINVAPATPSAPSNYAAVSLAQLTQGFKYRWQVQAKDAQGAVSGWSPWCEFTVSSEPLQASPIITSTDYPVPDDTHTGVYGGLGQPGRFTFTANGAAVTKYAYHLEGGASYTATAVDAAGSPLVGGSATVWVTPEDVLNNVLYVHGVDAAGNSSPDSQYTFRVGIATDEVSTWLLDEGMGTTASATGTAPKNLTLTTSNAAWTDGRILGTGPSGADKALKLTGGYAESSTGAVVTSKAFSVSAWVKLDSLPTSTATVISQDGAVNSAFSLSYVPPLMSGLTKPSQIGGGWCFTYYNSDASAPTKFRVCTITRPQPGVWTHLVGVYDPGHGTIPLSIYLDGTDRSRCYGGISAGNSTCKDPVTPWASTGKFAVGRGKAASAVAEQFPGQIAEVHAWNRATFVDLDILPALTAVNVGTWYMQSPADSQEGSGADWSGYNRPLSLSATNAEYIQDPVTYTGMVASLGGTSGDLHTSGPALDTTGPFSIAARVQITDPTAAGVQTIISQDGSADGAAQSGFALSYRPDNGGQWLVQIPDSATGTTSTILAVPAVSPADWHHLAFVYRPTSVGNPALGWITLYVDGANAGSGYLNEAFAPWQASGPLVIGRANAAGTNTQWLNGCVDTVRAFAGALTDAEVSTYANTSEP